jgi:hypothetical protein
MNNLLLILVLVFVIFAAFSTLFSTLKIEKNNKDYEGVSPGVMKVLMTIVMGMVLYQIIRFLMNL